VPNTSLLSATVEYLPLWQSFVGALGAFAVAAFTVWRSNKHASDREERQARRARNAERQAMLREKLEIVLTNCEASYGNMLTTTQYLGQLLEATRHKRPLPAKPSGNLSFNDSISAAVVTARIYFPSLAESVYELHRQLRDHFSLASDQVRAAIADSTSVYERPSIETVKALRFAILDEARRLIENDFELKGD
jgi:hypothetical protein